MKIKFGKYSIEIDRQNVKFPKNIDCPRCQGEGVVRDNDESFARGRVVTDACYHCANTGHVSGDRILGYMVEDLAMQVADKAWSEHIQPSAATEPDDYGFNWKLCAAERGLSQAEYKQEFLFDQIEVAIRRYESWTDIQVVKTWHAAEVKSGRAKFDWMK